MQASVMELAYIPALEAGFWEFDSPRRYGTEQPRLGGIGRAAFFAAAASWVVAGSCSMRVLSVCSGLFAMTYMA